ncbi:S-glutathionyl-(chloro)hydroquinone reductase [Tieghemiomyces parasiticus]|uniref:S-glutathionyl-(Chloro)hydroquinone reductase n=1 Tax=Tieghemiomyces parasiticus TaxID=78921 RepID=A0A9W8DZ63_9FUNG|nr:S-glutathionyl-(chloro)hydroquinone reductase [Tieghemiomyces parasiticus]
MPLLARSTAALHRLTSRSFSVPRPLHRTYYAAAHSAGTPLASSTRSLRTAALAMTNQPSSAADQPAILKWANDKGEFHRQVSSFRNEVSPAVDAQFPAEAGRYHLYISLACPWAHRTLLVRNLKGLDDLISLSVVHYHMGPEGWKFATEEECPGAIPDTVNHAKFIREVYFKANPNYEGRFTVPVLWDKKLGTIVNNESSEIIRMFNSAFDHLLPADKQGVSYYPEALRPTIDELNGWIYDDINNGVYKSGFATQQGPYEENCRRVFTALDRVEAILAEREFLAGDGQFTEADIRLFTTIVRFDPVYHGHFKCNIKGIEKDYPNILRWTRQIYQMPKVAETVNLDHIKRHYYMSHGQINPTRVVPLGTGPDLAHPIIKPQEH